MAFSFLYIRNEIGRATEKIVDLNILGAYVIIELLKESAGGFVDWVQLIALNGFRCSKAHSIWDVLHCSTMYQSIFWKYFAKNFVWDFL